MKTWLSGALLLGVVHAGPVLAELTLGGGIEYFDWREDTTPEVKETGPLLALHLGFAQDKAQGFLLGAKGRMWLGSVDYEGAALFTNPPQRLTGTTDYFGVGAEAQLRYRTPAGAQNIDVILGLGLDAWERRLSSIQSEDYTVLSGRLGFELAPISQDRGLLAGLGVRYPFYVREDAHFDSIGARNNPILKPKGEVSVTAHIGFALDGRWRLIGYYESIWLKRSDPRFVDFGNPLRDGLYLQPTSHMDVLGIRLEYRLQ